MNKKQCERQQKRAEERLLRDRQRIANDKSIKKTTPVGRRIIDPSDKAKLTTQSTNLIGRSTLTQQDKLVELGINRQKAIQMTKYMASKTITELINKKRSDKPSVSQDKNIIVKNDINEILYLQKYLQLIYLNHHP